MWMVLNMEAATCISVVLYKLCLMFCQNMTQISWSFFSWIVSILNVTTWKEVIWKWYLRSFKFSCWFSQTLSVCKQNTGCSMSLYFMLWLSKQNYHSAILKLNIKESYVSICSCWWTMQIILPGFRHAGKILRRDCYLCHVCSVCMEHLCYH
jgi:hypothetical protein